MTFLPALADERFGVGAVGYGLMSGVSGLGAVMAGLIAPRWGWMSRRPWQTVSASAIAIGLAVGALGFVQDFVFALFVLAIIGASGLVFQTTTLSLMLSLADIDYHGRLQSMVVLGFSGFGLAALPLGALADATSLELVLAGMGAIAVAVGLEFGRRRYRDRRARTLTLDLA